MSEKRENREAIDNEYDLKHEDIKEAFKNACKIVFDDDVIINDISTKNTILIINYSLFNHNCNHKCLLSTTRSIEDNVDIFANDIEFEIEELIHHLNYKKDKWQSNVEEFSEQTE